jgi:hypothetical protein
MLEAQVIFNDLIRKDYEYSKVTMLMSVAYSMSGDEVMSDKFKAMSNIRTLREMKEIPELHYSKVDAAPVSSVLAPAMKTMNASLVSLSHAGDETLSKESKPATNIVKSASGFG